jgi:hypothetical protein
MEPFLPAWLDDTYLVGPPEVIFPHAIPAHENNLQELGLDFQPLKSACYINSTFHTNNNSHLMMDPLHVDLPFMVLLSVTLRSSNNTCEITR